MAPPPQPGMFERLASYGTADDDARVDAAPPKSGGGFLRRVTGMFKDAAQNLASSSPRAQEENFDKPAEEPMPAGRTDQLKWLARIQNISGSWGIVAAEEIEMTAAALLAFVRAGHTTRVGNYRRQVRKAADWLKAAKAIGFAAFARYRALLELDKATENADQYVTDDMRTALPTPTSDAERAALDLASVRIPAPIKSMDDLRIAALSEGNADLSGLTNRNTLIMVWSAVGKPGN
jgi:hypothetical protein